MLLARRSFLTGLAAALAAPAIVRASSLMPVRGIVMPVAPVVQINNKLIRFRHELFRLYMRENQLEPYLDGPEPWIGWRRASAILTPP